MMATELRLPATSAAEPEAKGQAAQSASRAWLVAAVAATPIICSTLLPKIAVPPFGSMGIGITPLVMALAIAAGITNGCLRIEPARFVAFFTLTCLLAGVPIVVGDHYSLNSMMLFIVLHLPFALVLAQDRGQHKQAAVQLLLNIALFTAWLGIAQYFLQTVILARYLFPIENFLPKAFVVQNFNQQGLLGFGFTQYRSNGVFALEPSYFAQLLGVAAVVEMCTLNRLRRLPVYGFALLLAHSGTGLAILAVCVPLVVLVRRRWDVLLVLALIALLLTLFSESLHLSRLFGRVGEFGNNSSSGFARFVGGFYLFDEYLWDSPWRTLFGYGAGSFTDYPPRGFTVAEMGLFKLIFEFGILGTLAYLGFLCFCMSRASLHWIGKLAIAMTFVLNGLYVPFPHGLAIGLLIWVSGTSSEAGVPKRVAAQAGAGTPTQLLPAAAGG